ncbi:MAG: T9SS type A sorting domain-containing protein, partial [Balneolaceae bacterium]
PGSNDIIFIGGNAGVNHTITLVDNLTINDPGVMTVRDTGDGAGILATGPFTISGSGQFILEDGATLQIGSPDGITLSDASGNIQTATRSFSENANYIYNGTVLQVTGSALPVNLNNLTIDNPGNVEADQSYRVNGTLFLTSGAFVIGDGLSLIANTKDVNAGELLYQLEIYGQPGYRMLSSPINTDFDNFLSGVLTQGYTGASLAGDLQPNVLWYEESFVGTDNQRWRAPGNSSDPVIAGRGYFAFMFGDIPEDTRYNDPLPYLLEVNGLENEGSLGEIDMNVTYTAEADTGWNMVGNPYGAAIDWDHPSWTKTNIDQTIYVWDPNTNQYLTWNGSTGDITDGIIAPFQGFWIKANDANPELILSEDAKTFGGSYAGKEVAPQEVPLISINAQYSRRYQSTAHFTFSETGSYTLDREDAYKLLPPPGISDYLEVYSLTNGGERLAINNIPRQFGATITIPFSINAFKDGFPITEDIKLNIVNFEHIPESWELELVNEQTGQRFDVRQEKSITVPMDHLASQTNAKAHKTDFEVVTKDENSHNQFKLIIRPGLDAEGLPDTFELKQNYPNPFNPATTFRFNLPIESEVKIEIYDMLGRRVANLVDGTLPAGRHERIWDASRFSSGVYISRMITDNGVFVKKLTLIK